MDKFFAESEKLSLSDASLQLLDLERPDKNIGLKQAAAEITGSLAASVVGAAAWSIVDRKYGLAGKAIATAVTSGLTKFGVKGGLETALLKPEDRKTSEADLGWGAVDGFAGVAASKVERKVADSLTYKLGYKYAGSSLVPEQAFEVGTKVLDSSLKERMLSHALRGTTGGFVGSGTWSTAHALYENRHELNTLEGLEKTAKEIGINTAFGTAFGLGLATGFSGIANSKEIAGYAKAALLGDKGLSKVDVLHFNDMHSALLGKEASLPQLATKAEQLRSASKDAGKTPLLFELGDNYSGNVVAGSTKLGYVETKAIEMMKPDATIPGNHVADVGLGNVDVDGWVKNIRQLASETDREMPALMANIELPAHPGLTGKTGIYKPYKIIELNGPQGKDQLGVIGLVTKELADMAEGAAVYHDAQETARKAISELNAKGVNKIVVLSHMGRGEDIELAKNVNGIAAIFGAHSHDIEPLPFWIKNRQTGADVALSQAGAKAQWLGEMNLTFKPDGTADKFRTAGRLHEITADIPANKAISSYIQSEIGDVAKLESRQYPVQIKDQLSNYGVRGQTGDQTPLGGLISRALLEGVNEKLPDINAARVAAGLKPIEPVNIMLKHTGDIKEGLNVGKGTDHLQLSNSFLNTGSPERELNELAVAQLTGSQLRGILNFAVHDLPSAERGAQSTAARLKDNLVRFFRGEPRPEYYDYTGNFIQTQGLRYAYDRSLPIGERVKSIEVLDAKTGKYVPAEDGNTYNVLTLFHPIEKWGKRGMITMDPADPRFADPKNWAYGRYHSAAESRALTNAQSIQLSQVDLLAKYLVDKGSVSKVDFQMPGHIRDLTTPKWMPSARPSFFSMTPPAVMDATSSDK